MQGNLGKGCPPLHVWLKALGIFLQQGKILQADNEGLKKFGEIFRKGKGKNLGKPLDSPLFYGAILAAQVRIFCGKGKKCGQKIG